MNRIFIDVREPAEYAAGHVPGALNLPLDTLPAHSLALEAIPKDAELVLYCRSGARADIAMHILRAKGYGNLINGINQAQVVGRYF